MLVNVILLIIGFFALIKGADTFVDGASGLADRLGIPQIVIGLTIVAFGTSAPEAAISISAVVRGSTGISIGNILGSNIINILLILGITACIVPLTVEKNTAAIEIPFVIGITVLLVIFGAVFGELGLIAGIIFWAILIGFFIYLIGMSKKKSGGIEEKPAAGLPTLLLCTAIGLGAVVIGSQVTVSSASFIAHEIGISERMIGLTVIAFGTSLPELMTSVSAAIKGKNAIAVGNIIGSNIFNILFVLGTTALIKTVPYTPDFLFDGIAAVAAAVLLFIGVFRSHRLTRTAGVIMLAACAGYFVHMLMTPA